MKIIRPERFYKVFIERFKPFEEELLSLWNDYKYYNKIIFDKILPQIAEDLELNYGRDYFTIDAVCYERQDVKHFRRFKNDYWAENISIAVEHEHNHKTIQKEINKLTLFAIPLKVVITYPELRNETEKVLQMAQDIITKGDILKIHGCNIDDIKFLLIFGYRDRQAIEWEGYLFCKEDGVGNWKLLVKAIE